MKEHFCFIFCTFVKGFNFNQNFIVLIGKVSLSTVIGVMKSIWTFFISIRGVFLDRLTKHNSILLVFFFHKLVVVYDYKENAIIRGSSDVTIDYFYISISSCVNYTILEM